MLHTGQRLVRRSPPLFTVPAKSAGVIQRFGHYRGEVNPGLHFRVPFRVGRVTLVPVKRQLKEELGFSTLRHWGHLKKLTPPWRTRPARKPRGVRCWC
ncbi:MAG TPA: SPFH domain-containing protein [Woeseiaceae bacterium]|nr:SPFH domain-containing protein [Woeseiaceae bacterium]